MPSKNYTALFVPANLLNQDSIVRRMVTEIPEEDWRDSSDSENGVEIIGWLYQFYISERKDEVIGAKSKVAAQDIPAATQLFTPHWIVRYMVENSLGRLWLESHPESQLRSQLPYYLESPDPHPLTPSPKIGEGEPNQSPSPRAGEGFRVRVLQPQDLTVCDPACGSGHILVYAFDLLFEIYREQGYPEREIPGLILTHNLFGLDIDDRAVQLASFAVLMKARAKNSRILRRSPALNIVTVRSTRQLAQEFAAIAPLLSESAPIINHQLSLDTGRAQQLPIQQPAPSSRLHELFDGLLSAFADADHLGSLITPPPVDAAKLLAELKAMEQAAPLFGQVFAALRHVVKQAELLRKQYWVVVANPPYMGGGAFNEKLKTFVGKQYPRGKGDLFAVFMERCLEQTHEHGLMAMINQHSWMFLSTYEDLRRHLLNNFVFISLLHLGVGIFQELNSKVVQSVAFILWRQFIRGKESTFIRLVDSNNPRWKENNLFERQYRFTYTDQGRFRKLPGSQIAYWLQDELIELFDNDKFASISLTEGQNKTANNDRFLRFHWEVKSSKVGLDKKWLIYSKGGSFRKWYGNLEYIIDWSDKTREHYRENQSCRIIDERFWYKEGITWTDYT